MSLRETQRSLVVGVFVTALAALVPPLALSGYGLDMLSEIMIFATAAIALDLLLGYGGCVSFGHAAFFGLGAYGAVLLTVSYGWTPWLSILGGIAISAIAAGLIGAFCVRLSGVGFFMMTLAFSQLLYSGAVKWRWLTGGSDGIGGLSRLNVFGFDTSNSSAMYLFALACMVLVFLVTRMIVHSQFGHALVGARENETRMQALGYATGLIKLIAFTISGTVAGFSGAIYATYNGFVSPDALSWGISGMLLLMVVLGGRGTLVGPIIGAAIFLLMKNFVSSHTEHWLLIVGGAFIVCVMFFPAGIYGLRRRWMKTS
jgi:branched-chain amino acid transport system permease protein